MAAHSLKSRLRSDARRFARKPLGLVALLIGFAKLPEPVVCNAGVDEAAVEAAVETAAAAAVEATEDVLISVPVTILTAPAQTPDMPEELMVPADDPPPQVTPAARMPQYQLRPGEAIDRNPADSPVMRFLLTTPSQLMLIETAVYIDGLPFRQIREQRIAEIQAWMQQTAESPSSETYAPPANLQDRVRRYIASTGVQPTPEELRWLLSQWVDGPTVLFLNENFQRFRAEQQPLFHVLDKDRDGLVSAEERSVAEATLLECDLNRDEVIESTEIAQVAADPRNWKPPAPDRLRLISLSQTAGASPSELKTAIWENVKSSYGSAFTAKLIQSWDSDSNGTLDSTECQALLSSEPDLRLRVDFNRAQPDLSRLSVVGGSAAVLDVVRQLDPSQSTNQQILIPLGDIGLEVSAVQGASTDQISLGAINDGYAMLPEIDPNGDGRLTQRERRELLARLTTFDRDQDGAIRLSECRPVIRLCLGLGPHVHEPLSLVRSAGKAASVESAGPEWFQQMDKNRDHDLTRREFPGTDEQFKSLDADQDGLISASEAAQSET